MKVSCLMVTQPGRESFASMARGYFHAQDYADKELVVVVDDGRPLGALRNEAVARADGELCMTWDDDDVYAPTRISAQVAAIGEADVCFLERISLKCRCGQIVTSNKRDWECSALFRWSEMEIYPLMEIGEDAAMLMAMKRKGAKLARLDAPELYQKLWHDGNTAPGMHAVLKRAGHVCGE